jgi:uncharacterized protein (TIGR02757 family)
VSKVKLTKKFLENLYSKYNRKNSADDPVWNVLIQQDKTDQEILAFISALYAFGNIKQINNTLSKILNIFLPSALNRILDLDYISYLERNLEINHRFLFHSEFIGLMKTLNKVYAEYGSLKNLFLKHYRSEDKNLKTAIIFFSRYLRNEMQSLGTKSRKIKFLFPSPENRSACKRINLFLRWMVRKDNVDLGLWNEIRTSQLIIPLDTHIYQIAKHYDLTRLKSPSWNMAVEITENLKKFDAEDPVKYDFALSHLKIK